MSRVGGGGSGVGRIQGSRVALGVGGAVSVGVAGAGAGQGGRSVGTGVTGADGDTKGAWAIAGVPRGGCALGGAEGEDAGRNKENESSG